MGMDYVEARRHLDIKVLATVRDQQAVNALMGALDRTEKLLSKFFAYYDKCDIGWPTEDGAKSVASLRELHDAFRLASD